MPENVLAERIKFVDYLLSQSDKSKGTSLESFEARLNLIYDAKNNIWRDYKELLEAELFAQKILKLCRTGK